MPFNDNDDYDDESLDKETPENEKVGHGRPPKEHQFKPGTSGNPAGRPKRVATGDFDAEMMKLLREKITLTDGGKRVRMTRLDALFKSVYSKAAQGYPKPLKFIEDVLKRNQQQVAVSKSQTTRFTLKIGDRELRSVEGPFSVGDDGGPDDL